MAQLHVHNVHRVTPHLQLSEIVSRTAHYDVFRHLHIAWRTNALLLWILVPWNTNNHFYNLCFREHAQVLKTKISQNFPSTSQHMKDIERRVYQELTAYKLTILELNDEKERWVNHENEGERGVNHEKDEREQEVNQKKDWGERGVNREKGPQRGVRVNHSITEWNDEGEREVNHARNTM